MARRIAVSGVASGIGRSLADLLRSQGEEVIGIDLKDAQVCADLSTPDGRHQAVEEVQRLSGGVLDGFAACAGVMTSSSMEVRVNFFGAARVLDGLRPALAASSNPRAAVVGSITGTQGIEQEVVDACLADDEETALHHAAAVVESGSGYNLYPSSKSALAQWMRRVCVTPEWAGAGIALNAVAPGVVRTAMTKSLFEDDAMVELMDEAVPMPLNGHAEPEAVAGALRWLLSPENTHVTGQVIYVDGGAEATLRGPATF